MILDRKKKNLAFTISYGEKRFKYMAETLKKSFKYWNPETEFKIFGEELITPISKIKKKKIYPKDLKRPKLEILSKLNDPNTNYIFIDADSIVENNISKYYELINDDELIIEYRYNKSGYWADLNNLNFVDVCKSAGLGDFLPYSINSGIIMWRGHKSCFKKSLDYILEYDLNDSKGLKGDEYYLCAAIQKCKTKINPINYSKMKICKLWNEKFEIRNNKINLINSNLNSFDIIHYGNHNYFNLKVYKILKKYNSNIKVDIQYFIKALILILKGAIKKLIKKNEKD